MFYRVGRTTRLGQKGEAILFLQPSEAEYMEELKKHGVSLQELSLPQLQDGLQDRRGKRDDSFLAVEMHPLAGLMQKALEAFVAAKVPSDSPAAYPLSRTKKTGYPFLYIAVSSRMLARHFVFTAQLTVDICDLSAGC